MAVAILAIAAVTLLEAQSQSVSVAMVSRFNTTASLLASGKITQLQLADFTSLSSDQGFFEEPYTDYGYSLEVWEPSEDEIGLELAPDILKAVELTIIRGDDEALSYSLRAIIARPSGTE